MALVPTLSRISVMLVACGLLIIASENGCHSRYLPTRNYGDNMDKLRELINQILESSNENEQHSPSSSQLLASSATSPLFAATSASSSSSHQDRSLPWPKSNVGVPNDWDLPESLTSSSRADRPLRKSSYDANTRLRFFLKHPQRFINNLVQLM